MHKSSKKQHLIIIVLLSLGHFLVNAQGSDFPASIDLTSIDENVGFFIPGEGENDDLGMGVSSVGDVNADGIDDLLIGAWATDRNGINSGTCYVIFGRRDGFPGTLNLSAIDGNNGFRINGVEASSTIGRNIAGAGDFNGDGFDDIILSESGASRSVFVIFGASSFQPDFNLSSLDGNNGFIIDVPDTPINSSRLVNGAGDVNNDGFGDLIIGVPGTLDNRIQRGAGYIVYGTDESLPTIFDLSSVDGNNGFIILGNDELGYAVGGAGDFNNDGIDDVMISQPGNSFFAQQFGSTFIIFGSTSFEPILRISELDETDYVRIKGEDDEDLAGITSDAVGDFNGDGISDIILGATKNDNNTGAAYIIFGSSDPPSLLELSSLDGINGLKLLGVAPERSTGNSVSSAGDVNGDGLDDVIIGSFYQSANRDQLGTNYVVFGTKDASLKELSLADLNGDNGFSITGQPGWDVSNAGDINGDTFSDVIIGVPYNSDSFQRPRTGSCYVILGNGPLEPILINPIPDQQAIVGEEYFFTIPLNTFEDLNRNDSQTISVSLEGGGLLPDWLAFDPQDNSLKGTPLNQDVGTISLEVKNTDEDGLFATDVFELDVIIVTAVSNYTNNGFKMYPIPFSSQLNINIQNDEVGLLVVTIHDLTGKLIYTETMIKDRVIFKSTVNASDLNSGVYLMQVDMNDKFKSVYRIIKE